MRSMSASTKSAIRISLTYTLALLPIALIGGWCTGIYTFNDLYDGATRQAILEQLGSLDEFCLAVQYLVYTAFCGFTGFLLAKAVGRELGMTPMPLLRKVRHNRPQSGIHGEAERRANVLGVYRLTQGVEIAGKRILLLDDILTTGATAGEAARVLKTAGAKEVHCAAVASAGKE